MSAFRTSLAMLFLLGRSSSVGAATFAVDTTVDAPALTACTDATPNDCSLRGAITAANALAEASTIDLPAGTYELTQTGNCNRKFPGGSTSPLSGVPLCLTGTLTIRGAGAATTIIDGKGSHRDLFVSFGADAELRAVTLTRGIGEPLPEGGGADGGNIRNLGVLRLTDSVVSYGTLPVGFGGAGAPGIYNAGALTLLRSTVTLNISQAAGGGGGIFNEGALHAVLTVIDSVISNNSINAIGGGIYNVAGATATVTGSTIVGNTALVSQGGGIYNDAVLTLIDSTVSGNESGSSGGGIANAQHGVADLNNVTITDNTSGVSGGGRGGGVATASPTFTVRNTIVAGNFDLASGTVHPDCSAPGGGFASALVSEGYNLIGDATGCSITGDTTGNVIGTDAKLGLLVASAGPTPTHALADDSPALEAGNPAPPGSGGTACAANDQRGFVRPIGGRCDIGAFERGGPFALTKITPPAGGDIGSVTALVAGNGFVDGVTVKLVRAGQPDIVGAGPRVDAGATVITTTFDLAGKPLGVWDVVVANPNAASETLAGAFTIEVGRAPDPWVEIVGGILFRHMLSPFTIFYGNRGNVDALAVPLTLDASGAYGLLRFFAIARPPALPDQFGGGIWDGVGITVTAGEQGDFTNAPLLLPVIPAGFTGILKIGLALPPDPPDGMIFADIGVPFFTRAPDPNIVATMVEGARDYSASAFGITIPETLVPDMSRYVTAQLETLVTDGRNALIATTGTSSRIYSLAQLQVDVALFAAGRVVAEQASSAPVDLRRLLARAGRSLTPLLTTFGPAAASAQQQNGTVCCSDAEVCKPCNAQPQPVGPSASEPPCSALEWGLFILAGGLDGPPPCRATEAHCQSMANAAVVTLQNGSKICAPKDCALAHQGGGTGGIRASCYTFPIKPKRAIDPNDKAGSLGAAAAQFLRGETPFTYVIHFENLDTATAPAAIVEVIDPLDIEHLDLDTFSLGPISFGDFTLEPSPGLSGFTGSVDLRPAQNIVVTVDASLDKTTGILTWRFASIDQATGQHTDDPSAGFLPPNVSPPAGEGLVSFSVRPKASLATGTAICNRASIVFDQNDPLVTPDWCNTIDTAPPESSVQTLAETQASASFPVAWGGTDNGSGVATYSVFVSENGGPFTPFVSESGDTSAMFPGTFGKVYAFYSVARDAAGNLEAAPATADTATAVGASPGPHDLAITAIKVPKRVTLTTKKPSLAKTIKVQVQNRSPGSETIDSAATLATLVHVTITSGGECAAPVAVLHAGKPQKKLPVTLKKKGKLAVLFDVTLGCANDGAKGIGHEDYEVRAHVNTNALGEIDVHTADDDCPRQVAPPGVHDPFPDGKLRDKGCGAKKVDKTFGAPITIDVVVKP